MKILSVRLAAPVIAASVLISGCQSGLYKVSTSEDDKSVDNSIRYYEVASGKGSVAADFMKDGGSSTDGILYDEERMPVEIVEGRNEKFPDKPGWSGVLWLFTVGIWPMCHSEYMTQDITVKSPIGEKSGSYRVDAKWWAGWFPIVIGYPGSADERSAKASLPNLRLERVGKDRLVKNLVGEFSYKEYVSFAKAKNNERKSEIVRIKDISQRVNNLVTGHKFDDALTLIDSESKTRTATQECDKKSWADMREHVNASHQAYDKNRVESLIASGKFEEAIAFCDGKNSMPINVKDELKNNAVNKAVKDLNDAKRLVSFLKLIKEIGLRDDVVMKLNGLKALTQLPKEQLVEIANTSSRQDVVLAAVENIADKSSLISLLDKKHDAKVMRAILEKIADADAVRAKICDAGEEDDLIVYVSVYGSDDECMKMIKSYPQLLTDAVIKELKEKITNAETKHAVDELQTNRLAAEIANLKGSAAVARIKEIPDESMRSKMAKRVLFKLKDNIGSVCSDNNKAALGLYSKLVSLMNDTDIAIEAEKIIKGCEGKIHFEGFYVGMPLREYYLLKKYRGVAPNLPESHETVNFIVSVDIDMVYTDMKRIVFDRTLRYKMFEKEDGEFWSAFMRKYIPAGKKKSLGETISDALDSGTYSYQEGYDDKLEEHCYIYKSMKYGTKVLFGEKSGTLVLEEYK